MNWQTIISLKDTIDRMNREKERLAFLYGPNSKPCKDLEKRVEDVQRVRDLACRKAA